MSEIYEIIVLFRCRQSRFTCHFSFVFDCLHLPWKLWYNELAVTIQSIHSFQWGNSYRMVFRMVHSVQCRCFIFDVHGHNHILFCMLLFLYQHFLWSFRWIVPFDQKWCWTNASREWCSKISTTVSSNQRKTLPSNWNTCNCVRVSKFIVGQSKGKPLKSDSITEEYLSWSQTLIKEQYLPFSLLVECSLV